MTSSPTGISITRNEITGSARIEIDLGSDSPTLAYRVTRQVGTARYVIHDPFGAAIDGVSDLERAVEIAAGLSTAERPKTGGGHVDVAVAFSVVPMIIGLVVLALWLGLPSIYEVPAAIVFGVAISLGYALAGQLPGGTVFADALLRGVAVGLTSAGLIATIRRFTLERRLRRR